MKKNNIIKVVLISVFFPCLIVGPALAQGYSGLNEDKESSTFTEINEITKKVQEYEKKVALLERQKKIIEEKFYEVQEQRDIYYRLTLAKTIETNVLNEKLEYLKYVFKERLYEKDLLMKRERVSFDHLKDDWLFNMYEGKEIAYNPELLETKTRMELNNVKMELKETVDSAYGYEKEISKLSSEYNDYKSAMIKRTSLDEKFIDVLEDNLDVKKERINDLKDELIAKDMDLILNR